MEMRLNELFAKRFYGDIATTIKMVADFLRTLIVMD